MYNTVSIIQNMSMTPCYKVQHNVSTVLQRSHNESHNTVRAIL